jgi:hypothetical protein
MYSNSFVENQEKISGAKTVEELQDLINQGIIKIHEPTLPPRDPKKDIRTNSEFDKLMIKACYVAKEDVKIIRKCFFSGGDSNELKEMRRSCLFRIDVLDRFTKNERVIAEKALLKLIEDSEEQKQNYQRINDKRRFIYENSREEVCETIFDALFEIFVIKKDSFPAFEDYTFKEKIISLKLIITTCGDFLDHESKLKRIDELTNIRQGVLEEKVEEPKINKKKKTKKSKKQIIIEKVEVEKPKIIEKKVIGKCIVDGNILEGTQMMKLSCSSKCQVLMHMSCYLKHKRENGEYTCVTQDCDGEVIKLVKILNDEETELTVRRKEKPVVVIEKKEPEIKKKSSSKKQPVVKKEDPKPIVKKETEVPKKEEKIQVKVVCNAGNDSKLDQFFKEIEMKKKQEEELKNKKEEETRKKQEEKLKKKQEKANKNKQKMLVKTTIIEKTITTFWDEDEDVFGVGEIYFLGDGFGFIRDQEKGQTLRFSIGEKKHCLGDKVAFTTTNGSKECFLLN